MWMGPKAPLSCIDKGFGKDMGLKAHIKQDKGLTALILLTMDGFAIHNPLLKANNIVAFSGPKPQSIGG